MVAFGQATCGVTLASVLVPDSLGFHNLLDYSRKVAIPTGCRRANRYGPLVIMAV
jgi:hypothetical protein